MTRIDDIKKRLAFATHGPWTPQGKDVRAIYRHFDHMVCLASTELNAQLIAHAPSDLQYLLDRVEKLEAVVEQAKKVIDDYADPHALYELKQLLEQP
jgi:hypothetical protein